MEPKPSSDAPVPIVKLSNGTHEAHCSHCQEKVVLVSCPEQGHVVGLGCNKCNLFWPLILPE